MMRLGNARVAGLLLWGLGGCQERHLIPDVVPSGTWGGEDGGAIVSADGAHAHIGCTLGNTTGPIPLDDEGRFDVPAQWNVDAFPIDRGILHPARMTGWSDGRTMSLSARLTDTGQSLGPVLVVLGREPRMQNCPICRR
jgi:hypothetical protein